MILYLTGPSGAGKSPVGRLLAEKAGQRFIDLDRAIEERAGKSVFDIFTQDGEQTFRNIEKELLHGSFVSNGAVVATGGGTVLDKSNRKFMRDSGKIILLVASPKVLLERIGETARPLLTGDREKALRKLLFERAALYCDADSILNTTAISLPEIVTYIMGEFYEK